MYIKTIISHFNKDQKHSKSLHYQTVNIHNNKSHLKSNKFKQRFINPTTPVNQNNCFTSISRTPVSQWKHQQLNFRISKAKQDYQAKRQLIKQKIKRRIKQQLADLIRRNAFQEPSLKCINNSQKKIQFSNNVVVKAKFSPVIKQFRQKSDLLENLKKNCKIGSVLLQENPNSFKSKYKRSWSSGVKMRKRTQNPIPKRNIYSRMSNIQIIQNKNQINIGNKIEPWINFEDDIEQL